MAKWESKYKCFGIQFFLGDLKRQRVKESGFWCSTGRISDRCAWESGWKRVQMGQMNFDFHPGFHLEDICLSLKFLS